MRRFYEGDSHTMRMICSGKCRIAGLDTSAIAVLLGEKNEELVDSIRPEIWGHLEQLIAQRGRGHTG